VTQYCLVIPNGVFQNSADVFTVLDRDEGGAKTFSVKLSGNGQLPTTHWGCRTPLEADVLNALQNMNVTQFKAFVDQKAAERGRQPVGSITAFKNNVAISAADANFHTFIASLPGGPLQLVQEPL
jgi:hypothetical protein